MDTKIPQTTKDMWLPLLESGELTQARQSLYDDGKNGYCCLGIYAKACGASFHIDTLDEGTEDERESDVIVTVPGCAGNLNEAELLAQEWADTQGISAEVQELLSNLNDGGEHTIRHDNPLIDVWLKHATDMDEVLKHGPRLKLTMPQYTFAQIAEVIREDL